MSLSQAVARALHKKQKLSAVVLQAAAMFPELGRATLNSTNLHHTLRDRFKGNRFCKDLSETFEFRWSLELCKARVNAPLAIQRKSQSQCLQTNKSVVSLQNCQVVFLAILDLDSLGPLTDCGAEIWELHFSQTSQQAIGKSRSCNEML